MTVKYRTRLTVLLVQEEVLAKARASSLLIPVLLRGVLVDAAEEQLPALKGQILPASGWKETIRRTGSTHSSQMGWV